MKKIIRQFRLPFKSNSPNLKKKNHPEQQHHAHKTGLSTSKPLKKRNGGQTKPIPKSQTETGPLIKKVHTILFRKRQLSKNLIKKSSAS